MSDVRDFGAKGDGESDDTEAIQHALDDGDGLVVLPRGNYKITRPLLVDLARNDRRGIDGSGGTAKLQMYGKGPAVVLKGTHSTSADPLSFRPEEWARERMPTVRNLEIEGRHPEADGIQINGVMQPTLLGVLIREVKTAVHITSRARNVLISHCHFYYNTGIGVHLDQVNLHQIIITGSHISYCSRGGIRIESSEIRNFQVTGCDIEYNNSRAHKEKHTEPTAEVLFDVRNGSIREGTIASCTIQATDSENGSNIRFIGNSEAGNHKVGLWTIAGNLIGSQRNNIHLSSVRDVTITGNIIYSGHERNILIENSRNVVLGSNCLGHNPDYDTKELCTGVRIVDSVDCVINGLLIQDCQSGKHTVETVGQTKQALLELIRCRRSNLSGVQVIDSAPAGILLEDCSDTVLTGCTVLDSRESKLMEHAIRWTGKGTGNLISGCRIGAGTAGSITKDEGVQVHEAGNLGDGISTDMGK